MSGSERAAPLVRAGRRSAIPSRALTGRSSVSVAGCLLASVLGASAGCARVPAPPPTPASASPQSPAVPVGPVVGGVDWSRHVRDCAVERGGPGLGTLISEVVSADVTGDGHPDWLVIDECEASTSRWPQQIEVFSGTSDARAPVRLALLLADDPMHPRDLAVSVEAMGRVTVTGHGLSPDAPLCCPDLRIRRVFTWTGTGFALTESADTPS